MDAEVKENAKDVTASDAKDVTVRNAKENAKKNVKDVKKTLRVTQVKSTITCPVDQIKTIKALGLGKINRSVEQVDNPCVRGMIFKVKPLVKVEEI